MALLDTSGLRAPTFTDTRRLLHAVGEIHRESADKRLAAVLRAFIELTESRAAAVEATVNHRTVRLMSLGLVPASTPATRAASSAMPAERPRSGDRARRLRAERERQAQAAAEAAAGGGPAGARTPAATPSTDTAGVAGAGETDDAGGPGHGHVVRRQIRPGGLPSPAGIEGVPEIDLQPPTEASRGLASVRSVYRENGVTTALLGWRPAPLGPREVTLLQLFHPAVAWAIQPVRPAPGGVTGAVLDLLLTGLPEKEIAQRLNRSTHTVHAHVKRVYRHYGVRSRSELIVSHFRHGDEK